MRPADKSQTAKDLAATGINVGALAGIEHACKRWIYGRNPLEGVFLIHNLTHTS